MSTIEEKFAELGLNPPGAGHDLEQTYHETVQNIIRQHREAVMAQADPLAQPHDLERAAQTADRFEAMFEKIHPDDHARAVEAIQEAESYPQHVAAVGAEPTASVTEDEGGE